MNNEYCPTISKIITSNKKELNFGIHQPGYHRYIGYFYKMMHCDIFISLDIVQYVEREWQNRQLFYFPDGHNKWLSIPVNNGRDPIKNKLIINIQELRNHWEILKEIYRKTPYFKDYFNELDYIHRQNWLFLNDICDALTKLAMRILDINTLYIRASDYYSTELVSKAELLARCIRNLVPISESIPINYIATITPLDEHHYLNSYDENGVLEKKKFSYYNINLKTLNYRNISYKQYQFINNSYFANNLSIFDLIFNTGKDAKYLLSTAQYEPTTITNTVRYT